MQRILVIDDDAMIRRDVNGALSKAGFEVHEAPGAHEGIRCARLQQPDLILLDVMLPGMDGISVLRQLREDPATRAIPVIMVTSLGSEEQVAACLEEGAIDHVAKPFSHRLLCARVSAGLLKMTMHALTEEVAAAPARSSLGTVVAFLGAKGGVGTTTLAANAASAAALCDPSVILCEMRSVFGSLSIQLNAQPRQNLGTLVQATQGSHEVDWDDFLVRDSSGLRILFGPQADDGDINLQVSQARSVITGLRPLAKLIFLDLAAGLSQFNSEILKACERTVLVLDCEPTSVLAAKWTIDQLQNWSIRRSIKAVVVKRTELSISPKLDLIRSALGCDLMGVVPPGADALAFAVKSGATLVTLQPDDLVSMAISELTDKHLLAQSPAVAAVR